MVSNEKIEEVMKVVKQEGGDIFLASSVLNLKAETIVRYLNLGKNRGLGAVKLSHDEDLIDCNMVLAKSLQKSMDNNRIRNKGFRAQARLENALEEYTKNLLDTIDDHGRILSKKIVYPTYVPADRIGIVQISDTHLNELVDMEHNKFDFTVASKRLKKYANEVKNIFYFQGIKKVIVAFTGDLLNSDRRLDELLSQATNRAKATMLSVDLFKHFLLDLGSEFDLEVVSVLGNEGRVNEDMTFGDDVLSNNYDFTIMAILERLLKKVDNINFISYNSVEKVIQVGNDEWKQNILFTHDFSGQSNKQKDGQSTVGRIAMQSGVMVDYVICGHIHAQMNGDWVARSSSLVGSNAYSDKKLNLASRASQNCFVLGKDTRLSIGVDLQLVDENNDMYPMEEELMAYNAKSTSKTQTQHTILEIVTTI